VGTRRRTPRRPERPSGQHLLRSRAIADELVRHAGIERGDLVFEIGAGTGILTKALASRSARVIAVELDPTLAAELRRSMGGLPTISIVEGDALLVPLPTVPFRAFGNMPFGLTTAILRRLLDEPESSLVRVDVIVQYEAARKRAGVWPSSLRSLVWAPWWELTLPRHVRSACFEPRPAVDAGVLTVRRRRPPLLEQTERAGYEALIGRAFHGPGPLPGALGLPGLAWKRFARERGLARDAAPRDLDVFDWIALFRGSRSWTAGHPWRPPA
jgi:23S rRNA (adenine-N6)-dimethyltransferase